MMKVLIVEDNSAMRHLLRSIVAEWAEVFECEDGSQALSFYERHRPEWVLMDIRLPGMNGIEATRRILASYAEARVVIVTNFADQRMRESARLAGACGYVLKEDLSVLRQILNQ
jgi:CheY-like chemotaxis protein